MIVVKRVVAGLVGAMLGALIWFTLAVWLRPHADPNSEGCMQDAALECAEFTPVSKEPAAEVMPVACKGWLGTEGGGTAQLSDCLHSAREAARVKELRRAQAVAGST